MIALEKSFLAQEGRFEKCRIGDFFNVGTGSLLNAKEIKKGDIKRVSVKSDNNGIIGEFNTLDVVNARHFEKFISVNFFGDVFYHDYLASVEMKVHTLQLKSGKELNKELGLYLSSLIRKALNNRFGYGNQLSSSKLKEGAFYIELPILRGRPAWDFMERYIEELEAERIEELEAERIEELEAYLQVTGLKDYRLNKDEINVILSIDKNHSICIGLASQFLEFNDERQDTARKQSSHSNENDVIEWKEFKLGDLFNKIAQGRRLKKDDQMTGNIPFVMAGVTNSGVVNFISNPVASFPKNSITADIFGNIFYRNYNFGAGDDTGVYWSDKHHYSKETMLFFATSMACSLKGKYDFGKKLRSSQSKNIRVNVIVKNNDINYYYMNTLVSAIQKLVIKDVVKWTDKKIATTKKIVQKNKRF